MEGKNKMKKIKMGLGIIRELDKLGRLCIPKEMRDTLKLEKEVEVLLTPEGVLIRNPRYILVEKEQAEKNDE